MKKVRIDPSRWPFIIGCVSDTHIPRRVRALPGELYAALEGVDLILHAGDLVREDVLADLEPLARVVAVAGNMDMEPLPARLGRAALIEVGPWRIGLVHGDRGTAGTTPARALEVFAGSAVDAVVFGHSHQPLVETRDGVLLLNPGSPTDHRAEPWPTYGRLVLPRPGGEGARPRGDILRLGSGG